MVGCTVGKIQGSELSASLLSGILALSARFLPPCTPPLQIKFKPFMKDYNYSIMK